VNKKELNNLILNEIFGFGKKKEAAPNNDVEAIRQIIDKLRRGDPDDPNDDLTDDKIDATLRDAGFSVADIEKAKEKPSKDQDKPSAGRPGIISKGSPIRDEKISKAARGDKEILDTLLQIKKTDPKRLQRYAKFVEKPDMRLQRFEKAIDAKRKETLNFTSQIQTFTKIRNKLHSVEEVERLKTNAKLNKDYDFYNMLEVYKQLFLDDQSPKAAEPKEEPSPRALPPGETRKALPPGEASRRLPPGVSPRQLPSDALTRTFPPPPEGFPTVERFSDFFRRLLNDVRAGERTMEDVKREVGIRGRKIRAAADAARDTEARRQFQAYMDNINSEFASVFRSVMRESKQKQINSTTQDLEQIIREELENYIKEKK
jgi:hypothetical protein